MAYSIQSVTSDGTLALLNVSLDYFSRDEITVLFDNAEDAYPWEWVGVTDKQITFTPALPLGVEVRLVRNTAIDKPRHEFSQGAAFTTSALDEDFTQVLRVAQESTEQAAQRDFFGDINMHGYRVRNLSPGVLPGDALTVGQYIATPGGAAAGIMIQDIGEKYASDNVEGALQEILSAAEIADVVDTAVDGAMQAHLDDPDPHPGIYAPAAHTHSGGLELVSDTVVTMDAQQFVFTGLTPGRYRLFVDIKSRDPAVSGYVALTTSPDGGVTYPTAGTVAHTLWSIISNGPRADGMTWDEARITAVWNSLSGPPNRIRWVAQVELVVAADWISGASQFCWHFDGLEVSNSNFGQGTSKFLVFRPDTSRFAIQAGVVNAGRVTLWRELD